MISHHPESKAKVAIEDIHKDFLRSLDTLIAEEDTTTRNLMAARLKIGLRDLFSATYKLKVSELKLLRKLKKKSNDTTRPPDENSEQDHHPAP